MPITTLFFICLGAVAIGLIIAFLNFVFLAKNFDESSSWSKAFAIHALAALLYILGSIGAFITGIIWIVQTFKGA